MRKGGKDNRSLAVLGHCSDIHPTHIGAHAHHIGRVHNVSEAEDGACSKHKQEGEYDPESKLGKGHQRNADYLAEHQFSCLHRRHQDLDHTGALLFDHRRHQGATEHGDEHVDKHAEDHGDDHVDAGFGNRSIAALIEGELIHLHICLHIFHYLVQAGYLVTAYAVLLDGLVGTHPEAGVEIHPGRLLAEGLDAHALGAVQLRYYHQHVESAALEFILEHCRILSAAIRELGCLVAFEIGHNDAGIVHHGHLLALLLHIHHQKRRQHADSRKQYRHQESGDEETLFLDFVEIFAGYYDPCFVQIHFSGASPPVTSLMNISFILGISSL